MSKKKLAIIRDDDAKPCPFGLPVPVACNCAGESIERMAPMTAAKKDGEDILKRANAMVYVNHKTDKRCPYADKVLDDFNKVDCDFGDTGQGQRSVQFRGSPLYIQTFSGVGLSGLWSFPLGLYGDDHTSRNLPFGLFSLLGENKNVAELIKLADRLDEVDGDLADRLDEVLTDLQETENEDDLEEKMLKLEGMLDEYRGRYEEDRTDTGIIYEMVSKWFGPRAVPQ